MIWSATKKKKIEDTATIIEHHDRGDHGLAGGSAR